MTRRSVIRVLLSLLLLISQQMAFSHVIGHWSGPRSAGLGQLHTGHDSASKALAKHQVCDQCLAFAQIASAVGHTPRSFAPPGLVPGAIACGEDRTVHARAPCAFRSRAPPVHV
jgi:hypothetical protein